MCHRLIVEDDRVTGYQLRVHEQKMKAVAALKCLNYHVVAAGDSFNDTTMLAEANVGFLIHAPENVKQQFPQFQPVESHAELLTLIRENLNPPIDPLI
jgi:phosphoserine/homoserine phosphotransferase